MAPRKSDLIVPGAHDAEAPDGGLAIVLPGGDIHVVERAKEPELTLWQRQQAEVANSGGYFSALQLARRIMGPSYVEAIALSHINGRLPS